MLRHSSEKSFILNATAYTILLVGHLLGLYAIYQNGWNPMLLLINASLAYSFEQIYFVQTHLVLHSIFATQFGAILKFPDHFFYGTYVAWYHHYIDATKFTHDWLAYRVTYINFWHGPYALPNMMLVITTAVLFCQFVCEHWNFGSQYAEQQQNVMTILMIDVELIYVWRHIQGLVHEYYHVPTTKRANYFLFPPVNGLFSAFENIGIINSSEHKMHHENDRAALLAADHFFDMWVPRFLDKAISDLWQRRVKESNAKELMDTPDLFMAKTYAEDRTDWAFFLGTSQFKTSNEKLGPDMKLRVYIRNDCIWMACCSIVVHAIMFAGIAYTMT